LILSIQSRIRRELKFWSDQKQSKLLRGISIPLAWGLYQRNHVENTQHGHQLGLRLHKSSSPKIDISRRVSVAAHKIYAARQTNPISTSKTQILQLNVSLFLRCKIKFLKLTKQKKDANNTGRVVSQFSTLFGIHGSRSGFSQTRTLFAEPSNPITSPLSAADVVGRTCRRRAAKVHPES